ncbi:MAG TPA: hypothetical protein PLM55_11670 [Chitinophagales bacterium]|nr:hypothetical protein [Chitinophagales bacterium]
MSDTIIVADPLNPGLQKYDYDGVRFTFDNGNIAVPFAGGSGTAGTVVPNQPDGTIFHGAQPVMPRFRLYLQ